MRPEGRRQGRGEQEVRNGLGADAPDATKVPEPGNT